MKINKHQGLALFYIFFGLLLGYATLNIKYLFSIAQEDVGPKFFPMCCAVGFVVCGLGKLFSSKNKEGKVFIEDKKGWLRLGFILVCFVAYVYGMKYIGFIISSFLILLGLPYMLSENKKMEFWKVTVFSASITAITYMVFVYLIDVLLPTGIWIKALLRALR